jgi:hypothetical protein
MPFGCHQSGEEANPSVPLAKDSVQPHYSNPVHELRRQVCEVYYVLRITYCVLRITYYVLRIPYYVLRITYYVRRFT